MVQARRRGQAGGVRPYARPSRTMTGTDSRILRNAVNGSGGGLPGKIGISVVEVSPCSLERLTAVTGGSVRETATPMTSSWLLNCPTSLTAYRGTPLIVEPVSVTTVPPPM